MYSKMLKTEEALQFIKERFSTELSKQLSLTKVSSPIAVLDGTGINDDLNGVERTVKFPVKALQEKSAVIVNSLAKWKRLRLKELGIKSGEGILTDMKAIRPDEDFTPIHSIYVDQWDWEKHIETEERTLSVLKANVRQIYETLRITETAVSLKYPEIKPILPEEITFIHTEELLQRFPTLSAKVREKEIAKEHGAVFIIGIGGKLSSGEIHDGRAPDYDDWTSKNSDGFTGLNGDIIVWNPVLESEFEISSMGIRVDKTTLLEQLKGKDLLERTKLQFHQLILNDQLTQSIGGGIGQSRLCMFMLRKKHIGEVQVSVWPEAVRQQSIEEGICLL
ncbi:MAG: aspartate--ammonia ligase [Bacteroidetes bacterium]|nr:aspartate--ammonia ligase [Bacteroidota bacterium]